MFNATLELNKSMFKKLNQEIIKIGQGDLKRSQVDILKMKNPYKWS